VILFTDYGVIAEKLRVGQIIIPIFSMLPLGKTALDRTMIGTFLMVSACSIIKQSFWKIVQRAPDLGVKIVFVSLFFVTI